MLQENQHRTECSKSSSKMLGGGYFGFHPSCIYNDKKEMEHSMMYEQTSLFIHGGPENLDQTRRTMSHRTEM